MQNIDRGIEIYNILQCKHLYYLYFYIKVGMEFAKNYNRGRGDWHENEEKICIPCGVNNRRYGFGLDESCCRPELYQTSS